MFNQGNVRKRGEAMKLRTIVYSGLILSALVGSAQDFCLRDATIPQISPVVSVFKERVLVVYAELIESFWTVISADLSTDRGESFAYLGQLAPCPSCSQGMPSLAVDEDGVFFLAYLDKGTVVLSSADGGKSFAEIFSLDLNLFYPQIICERNKFYLVGTELLAGKILLSASGSPSLVTIPAMGNPVFAKILFFRGNLYCIWLQWPWPLETGLISPFGIPDKLAGLGPDLLGRFCRAHPASLWISMSPNGGQSWSSPRYLSEVKLPWRVELQGAVSFASFVSGGLEVPLAPAALSDPHRDMIYIVFPCAREDGSVDVLFMAVDPEMEVVLPPRPVGKMDVDVERFLPAMSISPQGVVGVVFYELDPEAKQINVILACSADGGREFHLQQINSFPLPIPLVAGQPTRSGHFEPSFPSGYIGESLGIAVDENFFYLAWVDFRNVVITPDYPGGRPDFDVYFRKVPIQLGAYSY